MNSSFPFSRRSGDVTELGRRLLFWSLNSRPAPLKRLPHPTSALARNWYCILFDQAIYAPYQLFHLRQSRRLEIKSFVPEDLLQFPCRMASADATKSAIRPRLSSFTLVLPGPATFGIQKGGMSPLLPSITTESEMQLPLEQCSVYGPLRLMRT